jgi:hypothetical protein
VAQNKKWLEYNEMTAEINNQWRGGNKQGRLRSTGGMAIEKSFKAFVKLRSGHDKIGRYEAEVCGQPVALDGTGQKDQDEKDLRDE